MVGTFPRNLAIPIPPGFCGCGCGETTSIAPYTHRRYGWVGGQPKRFIQHHGRSIAGYLAEDRGHDSPCWIWQGRLNRDGYGVYGHRNAHRIAYESRVGPVAAGLEIDHLCRQRDCVNPDHLEPVTHTVNMRRASVTRLTFADAVLVRLMGLTTTLNGPQIADMLGIDRTYAWNILRGHSWRFSKETTEGGW